MKAILTVAVLSAILIPVGAAAEAAGTGDGAMLHAGRGEVMTLPAEHFRFVPIACLDSQPNLLPAGHWPRRANDTGDCLSTDRDIRA